jgi:hypothetical protein
LAGFAPPFATRGETIVGPIAILGMLLVALVAWEVLPTR